MKINSKLKVRNVAGSYVVLMQEGSSSDMTTIISLNASAVELWNEFYGKEFEAADVISFLETKYNIDHELATKDATKWIESLKGCDAIL